MKIELQAVTTGITEEEFTPDEIVCIAARGDHSQNSMVGTTFDEAMEGTENNQEEMIEQLLRRGHFGCFEHVQMFFAVENISRVAMAQITRHRFFSFDVRSMRYTNAEDMEAVVPPTMEGEYESVLHDQMMDAKDRYRYLLEQGVPEEDARFVFPLATGVHMTFSANMRSLMHFFDLRNNMKAQYEAREFAQKVLSEVKEVAPITFKGYEEYLNNNSLRAP